MYDPGLQPERTRLSWQRSLLAFVLVVLVVLRSELPWNIAELIAFVGGASACAWLGWRVRRRTRFTTPPFTPAAPSPAPRRWRA